jgi:hypothetical protein
MTGTLQRRAARRASTRSQFTAWPRARAQTRQSRSQTQLADLSRTGTLSARVPPERMNPDGQEGLDGGARLADRRAAEGHRAATTAPAPPTTPHPEGVS